MAWQAVYVRPCLLRAQRVPRVRQCPGPGAGRTAHLIAISLHSWQHEREVNTNKEEISVDKKDKA